MKPDRVVLTFLICLLGLLARGSGSAQRNARSIFQFQHTSWTAKEGAPSGIRDLAQTTDGYLWMATLNGLYRFDGMRFEHYKPSSGQALRSDYVWSLMATADGGLWIGFGDGGADFLKNGRVTSYGTSEGFPSGAVRRFVVDHEGTVWTATFTGLAWLDGSRWQTAGEAQGYPGGSTAALFVDRAGTLWVGKDKTLYFLPRAEKVFQKCVDRKGYIRSIAQTPDGTMWLAEATFGASVIQPVPVRRSGDDRALPQIMGLDSEDRVFVDHAGSLWLGGGEGISRAANPAVIDRNRESKLDNSVFERFVEKDAQPTTRLIEDRDGNIWIASARGLFRFRESNVVPITPLSGPLVAGDEVAVLVPKWDPSPPTGLLVHLHGLTATSEPLNAVPIVAGRGMDGVIWMGGLGIWSYDKGQLVEIPPPEEAEKHPTGFYGIAENHSGLWISIGPGGVYRRANGVWSQYGNLPELPKATASILTTDSKGRAWFGYSSGMVAVVDGDRVRKFTSADGLKIVHIQAINVHGEHVWVGGRDGLALFTKGRFQTLNADGSAELSGISGIVETTNGDLWLNAAPGIIRIPAMEVKRTIEDSSYRVHCELFDSQDGLTATAVQIQPLPSMVESRDGRLWFLMFDGVVQIDPNHLIRNRISPSVSVRSVDSGGMAYAEPGSWNLPLRATSVHIEYTAPNLSVPQRVRFRYKLEGMDDDWQDAGTRREAFYTNLRPGHYRFRVIACNNDGVWNDVGAFVDFTIAPAWFQTVWFEALCVLVAMAIVWSIYALRLRQVTVQIQERLGARMEERERIARELHDTLLQGFQGLMLRFQAVMEEIPESQPARGKMETVLERADEVLFEGRERVSKLRAEAKPGEDLPQAIASCGEELAQNDTARFSMTIVGTPQPLDPIVQDEAYRIGREALANAFAHSNALRIEGEITFDSTRVRLSIRDNGDGIDQEILRSGRKGHWGLSGMRERAEHLGGRLDVWSNPGAGTEVELTLPAKVAYKRGTKRMRWRWIKRAVSGGR